MDDMKALLTRIESHTMMMSPLMCSFLNIFEFVEDYMLGSLGRESRSTFQVIRKDLRLLSSFNNTTAYITEKTSGVPLGKRGLTYFGGACALRFLNFNFWERVRSRFQDLTSNF